MVHGQAGAVVLWGVGHVLGGMVHGKAGVGHVLAGVVHGKAAGFVLWGVGHGGDGIGGF